MALKGKSLSGGTKSWRQDERSSAEKHCAKFEGSGRRTVVFITTFIAPYSILVSSHPKSDYPNAQSRPQIPSTNSSARVHSLALRLSRVTVPTKGFDNPLQPPNLLSPDPPPFHRALNTLPCIHASLLEYPLTLALEV